MQKTICRCLPEALSSKKRKIDDGRSLRKSHLTAVSSCFTVHTCSPCERLATASSSKF
jgi:hypothetical protein